ncbi:MAG: cadmium-translocating P-type ATPase [Ardenticatenaceae bacterium]|nr:cadmium-translocating P-type ATPase [Ardenticatenaceae bacterium]MCB9445698.1 cadmium-translocating P-type ATPase [Ardenticatenaceae bacterium]
MDTNKILRHEHEHDDLSCLEVINETVRDKDGIVNVCVDTNQETVSFDYNPEKVSELDIVAAAQRVAPTLHHRWSTCTMRLEHQGGRACESCAMSLERQIKEMPGIRRATASYMGGVLSVTYDHDVTTPQAIAHQVEKLGASVEPSASEVTAVPELPPSRFAWFINNLEAIFTVITLIAMVAGFIAERMEAAPIVITVLYTIAYVTGGTFGLKGGLESLRARTIDVDLLMILAALGAAIVGQPFEGVMLLFLFSLSNVLQDFAMDRTRNAIKALMKLRPNQANVKRGDQIVTLPIEKINISDRIVVKPGERIALDGVVLVGDSSVDQSSLTGESMPVAKSEGDTVFAGTINKNGSLEIGVTRLAKDSTIAKLIKMVEEAQSEKAETQRFIDTAEQYYALGVIVLTALVAAVPQIFGWEPFTTSFYRAMTVMVAASPCALVISTPATVLSAIGNGARRGILFKGGVYVENAATIKVVTFDKTGTLTIGDPQVTDIIPLENSTEKSLLTEDALLCLAAAIEAKSEHPLAQAVVKMAEKRGITVPEAIEFQATTGQGVRGTVDGLNLRIGNLRYFAEHHAIGLETAVTTVNRLQNEGKTSVVVAQMIEGAAYILGVLAFADVVREDAAQVIRDLKAVGVERVVMLTGDNDVVAQAIARQVGVDEVYADLLPEDKVRVVKQVRDTYGPVAMVGDGVNDAPALATATIGIAMGAAGTDVALETADIVLMSDDLKNIPYVIGLSRKTRRTLAVNLGFALFMIVLMLVTIFATNLTLPLAVIGHEGGTVLVSLNGMRLLAYKPA